MSVFSNIIDALRRVGRPTEKTALRLQDSALEGKVGLERGRTRIKDPLGAAEVFTATTVATEEAVVILSEDEVRPINENVSHGVRLLRNFGIVSGDQWTLDDLDRAFEAWLLAPDRLGYTDDAVVELFGAMFGHLCATQLNMRWIKLTDAEGSTLAVDGIERTFRAFPYQVVSKRIPDREFGFFRPVFILVKNNAKEAQLRTSVA
jgi:hypothetical protein